jgi:ribosome-binding factor A
MNHRKDRLQSVIQEELGKLIQHELSFPEALITITAVEVDENLETARIKLGILPKEKSAAAFGELKNMQGKLQFLLNRKLNIKPMPRIEFEIDHGAENAAQVEKLLIGGDNDNGN